MEKNGKNPLFEEHLREHEDTLERIIRKYGNDVLRIAYLYVKDIRTAEDIFQEVFLKVNEKMNTFEGRADFKTWLLRITINACKDYLRSAYHTRVVPMYDFAEEQLSAEADFEQLERAETAETVKGAVMALPIHYRDVILCVYFQEMSMQAAAAALDISVGTVKSRLSRAKKMLKEALEGRIPDER